jgi:ABC-2 type transport system permease protein
MRRTWTILKREYLENVRTKAFLIGLLLTPLWISLVFFLPRLSQSQSRHDTLVLVDETGDLGHRFERHLWKRVSTARFTIEHVSPDVFWAEDPSGPRTFESIQQAAASGDLFAVILTNPLLEKRQPKDDERWPAVLGPPNVGALQTGRALAEAVDRAANERLLEKEGISALIFQRISEPVLEYRPVAEGGQKASGARMMTPLVFMIVLFMGIVGISQMLINSTLEEKANRVFEVLLSSVSPFQLMAGKLLGICGVGFTLLLLWGGGGLIAAQASGLANVVGTRELAWFLAFYVAGFMLIASLMVAIGSACNTIKEAQNLMAPISIFLVLPLLMSTMILDDPSGPLAQILSFIPPFTPFVMMMRIASVPAPPTSEVVAAFLVLIIATWLMVRLAARIFRVGILMHGQPPNIVQIVKWLWRKD